MPIRPGRRHYARYLNLHANLPWIVGTVDDVAAAPPAGAADGPRRAVRLSGRRGAIVPGGEFVVGGLVLLAVTGAVWGVMHFALGDRHVGDDRQWVVDSTHAPGYGAASSATGGRVTWSPNSAAPADSVIRIGQRYELDSGWLNLELMRGTQVVIEGPAVWRLEADQRLRLESGKLVARVLPAGVGFTVATPAGEVIDLGTEFGVLVAGGGKTEVHVLQGTVEIKKSRTGVLAENGALKLPAGEAVRMEVRGNSFSAVALNRAKFASASQKLAARLGAIEPAVLYGSTDIRDGTITFQDGLHGYSGTEDACLSAGQGDSPDQNLGNADFLPVFEREVNLDNFRRCLTASTSPRCRPALGSAPRR